MGSGPPTSVSVFLFVRVDWVGHGYRVSDVPWSVETPSLYLISGSFGRRSGRVEDLCTPTQVMSVSTEHRRFMERSPPGNPPVREIQR